MAFRPARISDRIWQGGYVGREEAAQLAADGVDEIINLDHPFDPHFSDLRDLPIRISEVPVDDMAPLGDAGALRICTAMSRALDRRGGRVYVHCNAGLSRSPTAVWLYLVYRGVEPAEASAQIGVAAKHLDAPDPVLVGGLEAGAIRTWRERQRWALWRRHPLRQGEELLAVYGDEAAAAAERERLIGVYTGPAERAGQPPPADWLWIERD